MRAIVVVFRSTRRRLGLLVLTPLLLAGCARHESSSARAWDPDSIPEAYAHPSGALMWPGAARAWYVTPEGHLYNGDWQLSIAPRAGGATAAPRPPLAA